ncbi:hypothetical protein GGS23DRAFT_617505 [Durotheca rogersii]|uniref:uncharacterized protein n=1 Tax=Durotheca rogersii TaxID=419775 RepID=UPI00221F0FCD|nr:uncharacterized protein GGS23DRAFT_617505 [Durotheca rogersii]KAI5866391.1 hypothetical protein GGS23DRAFT_617505 [Durotheca rogersii]
MRDTLILGSMRAVKARGPDDIFVDPEAPVPTVPHTIGCDVAGRVAACGEQVGQDLHNPGDRVAGLCYGMKPGDPTSGAFGEYALLEHTLSLRIPNHVSDAEAATLPGASFQICADALTSRPGVASYTATLPVGDKFPRHDVQHGWTSGYIGGLFSLHQVVSE